MPPLCGVVARRSRVGGVGAKNSEYAGITDISRQSTYHPSVSFADSSPQGEPRKRFFNKLTRDADCIAGFFNQISSPRASFLTGTIST